MVLSGCWCDGAVNVGSSKSDAEKCRLCKIWFESVRAWEVARDSIDDAGFFIACFIIKQNQAC
jgi:hypothetical protein